MNKLSRRQVQACARIRKFQLSFVAVALWGLSSCLPTLALAQSVTLSGVLGGRALIQIEGRAPVLMGVGETRGDVRVLSVGDSEAQVALAGRRVGLRVGGPALQINNTGDLASDVSAKRNASGALATRRALSTAPNGPNASNVTQASGGVSAAAAAAVAEADKGESAGSNSGNASSGRSRIVLQVGSGGHYLAIGQINGTTVQFLVDTGATAVILGSAEAQRMGLSVSNAEVVSVSTANGTVPAYKLALTSVRIGGVEVNNVGALVIDSPLPYVLLGNTFLGRFQLSRENDALVLERRF